MMAETLLQIQNLRVSLAEDHGKREVVHGVSLELKRGEVLGLVGESGSGKSTIAKSILRILSPPRIITGGQLHFKGRDVLALDEEAMRTLRWKEMAMVFQSALNALNPVLTIGAHMVDTLQAHEDMGTAAAEKRARKLLELVDLDPIHLHSYPHELSGGMRQRVVIAIALAWGPDLLIMDEPTTALDVLVERQILREVLGLQKKMGFAILFITHDLGLLLEFADRVAVLLDGNLVEEGPAAQLQTQASHPYTRRLLGSVPSASGPRDPALLADSPAPDDLIPMLTVHKLCKRFPQGGLFRKRWLDAVRDLSFTLHKGEIIALVGASGSGKSTVARMICQLLPATSGEIRLGEIELNPRNAHQPQLRRRVQMIFQDPFASLNAIHSVRHHLARPLLRHRLCRRDELETRISVLLEEVGLTPAAEFIDKFPHEMSGGERQRVAIARVLAVEPDLIVADEPTSMLDLSIRIEILALLHRLRAQREVAFLFITHDLAAARYFADRILVLYEGRLVEESQAETLVSSPRHPYAQQLVAAASPGWLATQTNNSKDLP
jgi:ABC-type glutathione transport system ATPase component